MTALPSANNDWRHTVDVNGFRELLALDMASTADWRRRVAQEHPEDKRNMAAALLLDQLASTVDAIPADLMSLYSLMWEENETENLRHSELLSEELRQAGFVSSPKDATEFVKSFTEAD